MLRWIVAVLWAASLAQAQIELPAVDAPAEGELMAEHDSVAAGGTLWVGVRIVMKPKWHVYWMNPGDSGMPVNIEWTVPKGVTVSALHWPAPHRISTEPLMTYGYDDEVLLMAKLAVPADWKEKSIRITASAGWLVCADVCLEGGLSGDIEIPVREESARKATEWASAFTKARAAVPVAAPEGALAATTSGLRIDLDKLPIDAKASVYFFPRRAGWLDHAAAQALTREEGHALLALPRTSPDSEIAKSRNVAGVLVIQAGQVRRAFTVDLPIPDKNHQGE
jgi:thiol:disulfide interchange protein DsbD